MANMGRRANLSISQWFSQGASFFEGWEDFANCAQRFDLPWTSDRRPSFEEQQIMAGVCSDCPVIAKCARRGLGAVGGFYAGVWIPWQTMTPESTDTRGMRIYGRSKLKDVIDKAARNGA